MKASEIKFIEKLSLEDCSLDLLITVVINHDVLCTNSCGNQSQRFIISFVLVIMSAESKKMSIALE